MKKGYRAHGKGRVKRPDAAANAKSKAITLRHGGKSALLSARMHKGSREYKFIQAHAAELVQHLGGPSEVTVPERELIELLARLRLLDTLCWAEVRRTGITRNGQVSPAFTAFMTTIGRRADLLQKLGLQRRQKQLPTLGEVLSGKAGNDDEQT